MRRKLVAGNWKMNGGLAANARLLDRLAKEWKGTDDRVMAVCVPYPYVAQAQIALTGTDVHWGAQDVSRHAAGAFTGEVSAAMLLDFACSYAIVGHSERRQLHGETDATVGAKAQAAQRAGLIPIACVGETLDERERNATMTVVERQLAAIIEALGERLRDGVVAYEPVWAIGTGKTAAPEQAQAVHAALRSQLTAAGAGEVSILYGGSVKAANAATLFAMPDIDGALVGGASLDADEFLAIGRA